MTGLFAPSVLLTAAVSPVPLGVNFGGYEFWRRPSRTPVAPWVGIGLNDVPTGYTPAVVEVQHLQFVDHEAGWGSVGQWSDGWDYAYSIRNSATGISSPKSTIDSRNVVTSDETPWVTCNAAPYLNFPFEDADDVAGGDSSIISRYKPLGRDRYVTRARVELPGRTYGVGFAGLKLEGEDQIRNARAAAMAGRPLCLLLPLGDRMIGSLDMPGGMSHSGETLRLHASSEFTETATDAQIEPVQYNLPAGLVLDGAADYVTHADNALLDPASSAFSVVVAGVFPATNTYSLSKGNLSVADGFGIRRTGGTWQFFVDGATTSGGPAVADGTTEDGNPHVLVGTSSGTAQVLYRDGTSIAVSSVTHGAVANAVALVAGANNAGASGFQALAPLRGYAIYMRVLTPTEAQAAAYYLLGYPGYRMPGGAALFVDLRDTRTWNGQAATVTLADLSGNNLTGTIVSAPPVRGIPWDLAELERSAS